MRMELLEIFILAGGKSSRMGTDKGLVKIAGKPMIQHILETLSSLNKKITIIAHDSDYEQFGLPVIHDRIPDKGPLGGLYTALKTSTSERILLVSCDMPFITLKTVLKFISQPITCPIVVAELEGRILPFPGIYSVDLLSKIQLTIQENKLKFQQFIQSCAYEKLNMDAEFQQNPEFFQNINTLEEKEKAQFWLKKTID